MKAIEGFRLDVQHDLSSSLNEEANSCCTLNLNKLRREKLRTILATRRNTFKNRLSHSLERCLKRHV